MTDADQPSTTRKAIQSLRAFCGVGERYPAHDATNEVNTIVEVEIVLGLADVIVQLDKDRLVDAALDERRTQIIRSEIAIEPISDCRRE